MLLRRSIVTRRYCSTSRTQTLKRWATCVQAALTETGWLLPNLRRGSAATTLDRDKCPSTSVAINSPPSRWKAFGRLGNEGSDLIDQIPASIVGETDGSSLARKGVCKEHLFQIISVTTQVTISRRVHRYQLALRDRQATRGRREITGIPLPMTWGWSIVEE